MVSWQHAAGAIDWQSSVTGRFSSLRFRPDALGDLLFNGIAQDAYKRDVAFAWQTDVSYKLDESHTLRAGWLVQHDKSTSVSTSQVLPVDGTGAQTSDVPLHSWTMDRRISGSRACTCRTNGSLRRR